MQVGNPSNQKAEVGGLPQVQGQATQSKKGKKKKPPKKQKTLNQAGGVCLPGTL